MPIGELPRCRSPERLSARVDRWGSALVVTAEGAFASQANGQRLRRPGEVGYALGYPELRAFPCVNTREASFGLTEDEQREVAWPQDSAGGVRTAPLRCTRRATSTLLSAPPSRSLSTPYASSNGVPEPEV
jgi:hypothetical protein